MTTKDAKRIRLPKMQMLRLKKKIKDKKKIVLEKKTLNKLTELYG